MAVLVAGYLASETVDSRAELCAWRDSAARLATDRIWLRGGRVGVRHRLPSLRLSPSLPAALDSCLTRQGRSRARLCHPKRRTTTSDCRVRGFTASRVSRSRRSR
jgi:hypothetical protein